VGAGPVLKLLGPQRVYVVGGISATLATLVLLPIVRLRPQAEAPALP
jgi:hypothetical protein